MFLWTKYFELWTLRHSHPWAQYQKPRGGESFAIWDGLNSQWITHHKPVAPFFCQVLDMSHVLFWLLQFHPFWETIFFQVCVCDWSGELWGMRFFTWGSIDINWHQWYRDHVGSTLQQWDKQSFNFCSQGATRLTFMESIVTGLAVGELPNKLCVSYFCLLNDDFFA